MLEALEVVCVCVDVCVCCVQQSVPCPVYRGGVCPSLSGGEGAENA